MTRHSSARINLIFALLSLITAIFPVSLRAQNARPIRSPKEFLGFVPGEDRTIADWKQITSYFNHLDKASDRIRVKLLGASTLGKPLIAAFISSPENLRNMDKIQANQKLMADPRKIDSEFGPVEIIASGKVVVAISCSI